MVTNFFTDGPHNALTIVRINALKSIEVRRAASSDAPALRVAAMWGHHGYRQFFERFLHKKQSFSSSTPSYSYFAKNRLAPLIKNVHEILSAKTNR